MFVFPKQPGEMRIVNGMSSVSVIVCITEFYDIGVAKVANKGCAVTATFLWKNFTRKSHSMGGKKGNNVTVFCNLTFCSSLSYRK